jgi:hypothetical protein
MIWSFLGDVPLGIRIHLSGDADSNYITRPQPKHGQAGHDSAEAVTEVGCRWVGLGYNVSSRAEILKKICAQGQPEVLQGYLLVLLMFVLVAFTFFGVARTTGFFLKGFPAACIEPPVFEPKLDISLSAFALHFGHFAGFSDSLIGRINSNCFRHLGQRYSYTAIYGTSLTRTWPVACPL